MSQCDNWEITAYCYCPLSRIQRFQVQGSKLRGYSVMLKGQSILLFNVVIWKWANLIIGRLLPTGYCLLRKVQSSKFQVQGPRFKVQCSKFRDYCVLDTAYRYCPLSGIQGFRFKVKGRGDSVVLEKSILEATVLISPLCTFRQTTSLYPKGGASGFHGFQLLSGQPISGTYTHLNTQYSVLNTIHPFLPLYSQNSSNIGTWPLGRENSLSTCLLLR